MLFNSIPFLIFFTIYISSIFFIRNQWKLITIIFSIFFYAYWNFYFCFLLILEALFTWLIGNLIQKKDNHKKKYLIMGLVVPLIILFIFKYFNFFVSDILRIELQNTIFLNIILPIGISFYTFQSIMYLVDIYKDKLQDVSLKNFLVFFLFFPNLIAGPLVRPKSFIPQIISGINFNYKNFTTGSLLILWGFFLKLCVSNNLNIYVGNVFNNILELNSSTLLISSFFYSFLIYSDFAGYSLIAIGIAKLIGLNVPANFNNPFLSQNITEFWRRWHISLSKFLRDYLYIPLGGNKYGLFATCRNIIIVMLLGGLWHGASFNFIIWGGLHGIVISLEKINKSYFKININYTPVKKMLTFLLVVIFFIPFGLPSFESLILFWQQIKIFELLNISQIIEKFYVIRNLILIAILLLIETFINKKYFLQIKKNSLLYGFSLTVLLSLIICFGNFNETTFIYFQF
jgi:D-alanyl-lipoteichoic acid acyltransferase DltB (MBOAT superfamily)